MMGDIVAGLKGMRQGIKLHKTCVLFPNGSVGLPCQCFFSVGGATYGFETVYVQLVKRNKDFDFVVFHLDITRADVSLRQAKKIRKAIEELGYSCAE